MMTMEDVIKEHSKAGNMRFSFSYMQIYNEQVYDLLVEPI